MDIVRNPSKEDLNRPDSEGDIVGFLPIADRGGMVRTPSEMFAERLSEETDKASKKGLPFSEAAARAEYQDKLDTWSKNFVRMGYATKKKPTFDEIDWDKYCDLKNFELIKEDEQTDDQLSTKWRLPVVMRYKTYRFKGFKNTYTIMESKESALKRAQEVVDEPARKSKA